MRLFLLVLLLTVSLSLPAHASAAGDEARYNFASAQGDKRIAVTPGGEARGALYFYNVDGNRVTHVSLSLSSVPSGWEVRLDPPTHEAEFDVNGQPTKVNENLFVEPSELLARESKDLPAGSACIAVPGRGFAVAKVAQLIVRVPGGEKAGSKAEIRVSAEASWLGQSGSAAIKQARDFDFTVEVVATRTGYTESPLPPRGTTVLVAGAVDTTAEPGGEVWWPFAALGAVLAGAGFLAGRKSRRGPRV